MLVSARVHVSMCVSYNSNEGSLRDYHSWALADLKVKGAQRRSRNSALCVYVIVCTLCMYMCAGGCIWACVCVYRIWAWDGRATKGLMIDWPDAETERGDEEARKELEGQWKIKTGNCQSSLFKELKIIIFTWKLGFRRINHILR